MKRTRIITSIISAVLCLIIVFNSSAFAVSSQDDLATLEDISIIRQCGVLEGETIIYPRTILKK